MMRIAINGCGIAGPALAFWLRKAGHDVVLFEQAPALRTGGYVIDFWGLGYDLVEKMGLLPQLKERAYFTKEMRIVDDNGRRVTGMNTEALAAAAGDRMMTIARGDLAAVLFDALGDGDHRFGVSVTQVDDRGDDVVIGLSDGSEERVDLLVGADGLHSKVRELVFGAESKWERPMGCHVAAVEVDGYPQRDDDVYVLHGGVRRQVARATLRDGKSILLFILRSDLLPDGEPVGLDAQRAALQHAFGDMQWEVPDMLRHVQEAQTLYFDRVSQIHLDRWTTGRVALLGDAAACASLLAGEGSGLAITEAFVLAGELTAHGDDVQAALATYERRLRPFLKDKQKGATGFVGFFAPATRLHWWLRDVGVTLAGHPAVSKLFLGRFMRDEFDLPTYPALEA